MTRKTIEKMEAGRQIDHLVAEKVMGYVYNENTGCWEYQSEHVLCMGVPFFSTKIEAAWEIVEKIGRHDAITIDRQSNGSRIEKLWSCSTQFTMTEAPTAPLAICRAALLVTL